MAMEKYIGTGGRCAGKTTSLKELADGGFGFVQEALMATVTDLKEQMGMAAWKKWLLPNYGEFIQMATMKQIAFETEASERYGGKVLFDGGFVDLIASCRLRDIEVPRSLEMLTRNAGYKMAFLFTTFDDFDPRPESGRLITKDEATRMGPLCREVCHEFGIPVRDVPEGKGPVQEKTHFMLDYLI
jgi:predicted ATPase